MRLLPSASEGKCESEIQGQTQILHLSPYPYLLSVDAQSNPIGGVVYAGHGIGRPQSSAQRPFRPFCATIQLTTNQVPW